jgi:xanthine/CO dehydrogenase XdhC/CoxF family maturation factor
MLDCSDISTGEPRLLSSLHAVAQPWPAWRINRVTFEFQAATVKTIQVNIPARTRVLICGAGPDAVPVARVLNQLDWDVLIVDHRPAFAKKERFPANCTVLQSRPGDLSSATDLNEVDAVVIMSHHLENDSAYLGCLAPFGISYVGVLGPRARRMRLAKLSGLSDSTIFGPVGLDIGAELPASIALAVVAEIHAVLNQRDGRSLTEKDT